MGSWNVVILTTNLPWKVRTEQMTYSMCYKSDLNSHDAKDETRYEGGNKVAND